MTYFLSLFLGTFVLEDIALASSVVLMAEGKISFFNAFLACFLGISIGDFALYFIGYLTSKLKLENRFEIINKYLKKLKGLKESNFMSYSIVISRFIPGTRLLTYLGAGFLQYPFTKFFILTIFSVFGWVLIAVAAGKSLGIIFMNHWLFMLIIFLAVLNLIKSLTPKLLDPWMRKTLKYSWRKWLTFEFWPAWFFYIPIVPLYIYLSIKHRSFFMPFYANPELKHGGLLGESKWDFLKYLDKQDSSTLAAVRIDKNLDFIKTKNLLDENHLFYPLIIKPDIGQRGFGVRILRNDQDLIDYLMLRNFECLIQKFSDYPNEAGLFYFRLPSENYGQIFSVTDKKFPFVIGDGKSKLGDLILNDSRACIIATTYFQRMKKKLNTVPEKDEKVFISECGNHCQGAIFFNGKNFITPELTSKLESIARLIPDFYFGRFDIKYFDIISIKAGKNFEIVEINGAGSEATHIWDANTKLMEAYKTLFLQWNLLFRIGHEVKKRPNQKLKVHLFQFLKECLKVIFRKDELTISS